MTRVVRADDPSAIEQVVTALTSGQVVGIPTDTVYGLAADPFQPEAVGRVFAAKSRPDDVALPILVREWDQVELVAGVLPPLAQRLADRFWPGPLTLVVPRSGAFTADLGGPTAASTTVGIRWPAHPVVQALCESVGPLAVTSANRHGEPPLTDAGSVAAAFAGAGVALVLDGGACDGAPSTVVECLGPVPRCLRPGAIPWSLLCEQG